MANWFKQLNLANKLRILIISPIVVMLAILVTITLSVVQSNMTAILDEQMYSLAQLNQTSVQSLVDGGVNVAKDLQAYLNLSLEKSVYNPAETEYESEVYPQFDLTGTFSRMEDYYINTAWSAINDNPDLASVGLYFEPYIFSDLPYYGAFIDENAARSYSVSSITNGTYLSDEFYNYTKSINSPSITRPRIEDGQLISYISYPLNIKGEFVGVVVAELLVSNLGNSALSSNAYETLFSAVLTSELEILYDSEDEAHIGMYISEFLDDKQMATLNQKISLQQEFKIETTYDDGRSHVRYFLPVEVAGELWWAHVELEIKEQNSILYQLIFTNVAISLVSLIILVIIVGYAINRTLDGLNQVVQVATEVKSGSFNTGLVMEKSGDEIGELATTFEEMAHIISVIVQDIENVLGDMAKGNFIIQDKIKANYVGDFAPIKTSMLSIADQLSSSLKDINHAAHEVSVGAEEIAKASTDLVDATGQQMEILNSFEETTNNIVDSINKGIAKVEQTNKISIMAR
ncbi:MAG: hypothetical protein ATN35_10935, partial [Epulopiscium sp. Nele67-Bin004]